MIEFKDLSVCYEPGARHPVSALENINLKINAGEWVFLVGPSGAGKSTLLKLLHCGVPTTANVEGQILLYGQDITHLPSREVPFVRRKIGVVFQDFQLLAQKTAWENVAFALRVIGEKQSRIAREVPLALDIVGLAHRANAQPHELSGGEQQRIAIARAIVNNPSLLLADEPTGNLDPDTAAGLAEVLQRINKERGTTVVMATHDRHLVDSLRMRVVRVRDGKIASDEASGVYHPEDDEPSSAGRRQPAGEIRQEAVGSDPARNGASSAVTVTQQPAEVKEEIAEVKEQVEEVKEEINAESAPPETVVEEPSTPAAQPSTRRGAPPTARKERAAKKPRVRLIEPQDTITREALQSGAPLGSDENPIVQYGRK